ncbi:MAG: S-methyl-5'-thioadenosine phosphorylase [Deltaproteobacteria bacterium]|nr:S-methyl-5'-thioadenosine phosphorylase [Deltaproteobacteria bacterium]
MKRSLAILGGSGLYDLPGVTSVEWVEVETPYGPPSDAVLRARLDGDDDVELLFLPRHGRGHRIPPHRINYRANVCALKMLGAEAILSVSATGSMKESIAPGDLVVIDQVIDLTRRRTSTFFDGIVAHVAFSQPICPVLASAVHDAASRVRARAAASGVPFGLHLGGSYVCIEGPQFSTRAESLVYRSWGVSLIGMTNMPEAKLAREAELPYATLGLATDYDCWHESEEAVDVQAVVSRLRTMTVHAREVVLELARSMPDLSASPARSALAGAIMTAPDALPAEERAQLAWLLGE